MQLHPGEFLEVSAEGELSQVQAFDKQQLQWLRGRLSYEAEPLANIVGDVNRYRAKPIVLASDAIGQLRVTASFPLAQSDQLLEGLGYTHHLQVQELPNSIVIRKP